ncbi:G2E3 ligase, partial [Rhinopomastus cyanomelas]|nr:G2E3 ligase [Rhinopomastus cyanomelas]
CCVCRQPRATINCWQKDCGRSFHLPCAGEGGCVTQYFGHYRSFCWEHRPEQAVLVAPKANTTCLLCLDPVEVTVSFGTLACPTCRHAWFHRGCIQGHAARTGISAFRCPLCRDSEDFQMEMLYMGISIPFRLPDWDEQDFVALNARHSRCDASVCCCPAGREQAEPEGPWHLLLCGSCAAEGTHRLCSQLDSSTEQWECCGC